MRLIEKKYSIFELKVVGVERRNGTCQYYICENCYDHYIEVLTGMKILKDNVYSVESLSNWYPRGYIANASRLRAKGITLAKLSLKEILDKYNEINYVNFLLENDEEVIEEELINRGLFEDSKIYKKRVKKRNTDTNA